jgi:hypothetical protein
MGSKFLATEEVVGTSMSAQSLKKTELICAQIRNCLAVEIIEVVTNAQKKQDILKELPVLKLIIKKKNAVKNARNPKNSAE